MQNRWLRLLAVGLLSSAYTLSGAVYGAEALGTVESLTGTVMVNHAGKGYVVVNQGAELYVGDRVLVMDESSAMISAYDGCRTELGENSVFSQQTRSHCAGGLNTVRSLGPFYAKAIGGTSRKVAPAKTKTKKPKSTPKGETVAQAGGAAASAGISTTAIWIGAGVGGALLLIAASSGGSSSSGSTTTHIP